MNIQQLTQEVKELEEAKIKASTELDYLTENGFGYLDSCYDYIQEIKNVKSEAQKLLTLINEGKIDGCCETCCFLKTEKIIVNAFCPSCQSEIDKNKQILQEMVK